MTYRIVYLAIAFGHIHDGGMWELGDAEALCFRLISLLLSVFWLKQLMLNHGVFVFMLERFRNVYDV